MTVDTMNAAASIDRYAPLLGAEVEELRALARPLKKRSVLMVNSTAVGGGVSNALSSLFSGPARTWSAAVLTVQSVGYLFSEQPDSVVLAQSFDSNQDPNPNGMLQIPRSAIRSIHNVTADAQAEFDHP